MISKITEKMSAQPYVSSIGRWFYILCHMQNLYCYLLKAIVTDPLILLKFQFIAGT